MSKLFSDPDLAIVLCNLFCITYYTLLNRNYQICQVGVHIVESMHHTKESNFVLDAVYDRGSYNSIWSWIIHNLKYSIPDAKMSLSSRMQSMEIKHLLCKGKIPNEVMSGQLAVPQDVQTKTGIVVFLRCPTDRRIGFFAE